MPNWSSRLEVHVAGQIVSPITSFTTAFATAITPIHSIEADNVGVIKKPQTITFTMTVPAVVPVPTDPQSPATNVADIYKLAVNGSKFDVALVVRSGNDWAFKSLLFQECYITSASPSNVTVGTTSGQLDTVPVATFSGVVTKFLDTKNGTFLGGGNDGCKHSSPGRRGAAAQGAELRRY